MSNNQKKNIITVRVDDKVLKTLKLAAKKDRRPLSSFVRFSAEERAESLISGK